MKPLLKNAFFFLMLISLYSCMDDSFQEDVIDTEEDTTNDIENVSIDIPDGFDYKTHDQVSIQITDATVGVKYDVYAYSDTKVFVGYETYEDEEGNEVTEAIYKNDIMNKLVFSGVPVNGEIQVSLTLPEYSEKIYLRRQQNLKYSSELIDVIDNEVVFEYLETADKSSFASKANYTDVFYTVNGYGELMQIDPLDGSHALMADMPMGSWTAAVDQENKKLYSIGYRYPNPLMRYDIETDEWSIVDYLYGGGPRLEFNDQDGLLYFSNNDKIYTINPDNGDVLKRFDINGLHYTGGGDLVFDPEGTLYLATHGGLYRLTFNGSSYDSYRISADSLPFSPTSLTFDSKGDLWLAGNSSNENLIVMDTHTGSWQYVYGIDAANDTNFGRAISDLTTFTIYSDTPDTKDSDGDGVVDSQDAYPDEADKAFEIFTPSKYGKGTLAFEDLWPYYGDYDFNDVALSYRAIAILNSNNKVVQLDFICHVKANGAGFTNAFGIELEGVPSNFIQSVTGTKYSHDYIEVNANGTEANQQNAVIIFTDDQDNFLDETTVSIKFTQPISTNQLGTAPFNPFIIKNKVRADEIHLPYYNRTDLGQNTGQIGNSKDLDGNYISNRGYPWAISVIHDFKVPKEKVAIDAAYNYFTTWATSGGEIYKDWYKDNPGFRNVDNIRD